MDIQILYGRVTRTTLVLACSFLLLSCSYYPEKDTEPAGLIMGEFAKCANPGQQSNPNCYCHKLALANHPERQAHCYNSTGYEENGNCENPLVYSDNDQLSKDNFSEICQLKANWNRPICFCEEKVALSIEGREEYCTNLSEGALGQVLTPFKARSLEWLVKLREFTMPLEHSKREDTEVWANANDRYSSLSAFQDDCDAVDSLLDFIFLLGQFELYELAKVLVDSDLTDDYPANHYVAAIWLQDDWYFIEFQSDKIRNLADIEKGGYPLPDGSLAPFGEIAAHRRLDQTEWYWGLPIVGRGESGYCPTGKLAGIGL